MSDRSRTLHVALFLAASAVAAGCCKGGDDEDHKVTAETPKAAEASPVAKAAPAATTAAAPAEHADAPTEPLEGRRRHAPKDAPTDAPGAMGPDGYPVDIPATRSKVPTMAEWDAVTREINVARSTPLGCETKMLREWVRISCRKANSTGGKPTEVETVESGGIEAFTFGKNGVTSVVAPVLRGKRYQARFSWTDKTQLLVISWPAGVGRPLIKFTDG
jgi:hypothetical protein